MSAEDIKNASMLDIVTNILKEAKEPISIYDIIDQVAKSKGISSDDVDTLTQLYMDITLSAKFVFVGEDKWALKEGHLEYWDKDGYAFVQPDETEDFEDEELDFTEFNLDDLEEQEDEELDEEEVDEEVIEEKAYIDVSAPVKSTDDDDAFEDVDLDIDEEDYDEDDYNEIMDDYEDMYDE